MWDDLSTVYMAAQLLGYDKPDPSHLYNLTDQELDAVKKKVAGVETEHPEDVVNGRRVDQPVSESRESSPPWDGH